MLLFIGFRGLLWTGTDAKLGRCHSYSDNNILFYITFIFMNKKVTPKVTPVFVSLPNF